MEKKPLSEHIEKEAEWKEIVQKHDDAVVEWRAECQRLQAEDIFAEAQLEKPRWHLKLKLPVEEPIDSEDEESSSSSSGSND